MRFPLLSGSLSLIAGGILVQASLAGMFISGSSEARMIHLVVGSILPYLAIVPTVSAWRRKRAGGDFHRAALGTTLLLVGLWVQEALGHVHSSITTAIHVPLGVLVFTLSVWLVWAVRVAPERPNT